MAASTKQQGSFKFPDICIVDTETTTNSLVNEHSSLLKSASVSGGSMSSCNYTAICIPSEQPSLSTSSSSSSLSSMGSKKSKKGDIWFSIYLLFYISYLVLGSVAFQSMEVNTEIMMRQNFRDARQTFLQKYSNVMDEDLEALIADVLEVSGHGVSPMENATSDLNWGFVQALFFSSTVITTIGYGHVTPLTQSGKLFCILYAIVGIPLTLVMLSAAVKRLLVPTVWILRLLNLKLGHRHRPLSIRVMHLLVIGAICSFIFLIVPTILFAYLEPGWTTLDAFYYCFISLTTIGLGDYIPGDQLVQPNRELYKLAITFYLFVGLIAVMLCLAVFYDIPQLNLGQLFVEADENERANAAADQKLKQLAAVEEEKRNRIATSYQCLTV